MKNKDLLELKEHLENYRDQNKDSFLLKNNIERLLFRIDIDISRNKANSKRLVISYQKNKKVKLSKK